MQNKKEKKAFWSGFYKGLKAKTTPNFRPVRRQFGVYDKDGKLIKFIGEK